MVPRAKLLVLALVLLASAVAFGQATSGDVIGTVLDKSGAVVSGATVTAVNQGTGVTATTTTSATGEYRFGNLAIGKYDITAAAKGFATATIKSVIVELNKTLPVKFNLSVASVSTQVEVTEAAAAIDTATAQLQTSYGSQLVQDLPTASVGSGVLNLALLQAGVATANGMGAGAGPSVGGQRPRNNNFTVEGVDNNDKGVTGPLITVPNDAVAEFTMQQNQFSPEFGHSTGGQFNSVVQSGTNTFHGRAYEYFQNKKLNAIDTITHGVKARYDNNRFGGQIGGPVFKNKLFFFANFEDQPIGQVGTPGSVQAPTTAGYQTLATLAGVSAANVGYLKQFITAPKGTDFYCVNCPKVLVTDPTTGKQSWKDVPNVEVGDIDILPPSYYNTKRLVSSMDYNISDRDQLRGRYIWNKQKTVDTAAILPQFFTDLVFPTHLIALSEFHTFTPNINNEFRIGYSRTEGRWNAPTGSLSKLGNLDMFPNISIDEIGMNLGPDPNAPQYNIQNTYQLVDNITWVKGAHTIKFGGEVRKAISPQLFVQRYRGDYEWATLEGYLNDAATETFTDVNAAAYQVPVKLGGRDGLVFAERSNGGVGYSGDTYGIYGFFNDAWKFNEHLTLQLGVRYEFNQTNSGWTQQALNSVANVPGLITFDSPQAPKKNFMPRIGFAYSPGKSGNTSVRGGFGMGYDVLYDNIGTLARPPQIGSTLDCPGVGCPTSNFLANGGIKPGTGSGISTYDAATARALTASYLPNQIQYPYSIQWNLGVQHVFATNYTAEIRYVGTRGVHLNVQTRLNSQNKVSESLHLPTYLAHPGQAALDALTTTLTQINAVSNYPAAYKNAGFDSSRIVAFMPWGSSIYHGLQTQLNRRFANGLQFQAAYTWSHAIDNSTADFFSTVLTPRRPQDFQNWGADRSNSALDRRHRITVSAIYEVPWFKSSNNWFLKNIAGNFQFAPIYTYETGEWADVQSNVDSNLNGDNAGDRAVINPKGDRNLGSGVTALTNTAGATVAYLATNPKAYYIVAGSGALATDGRNTLKMPPINNVDLTATKKLNFGERYKFEFSAQMLNALNHPQWIANSINDVLSQGRSTGAERNYLIPNNTNFNQASKVFPSNARTIQLSTKFIF